MLDRGPRQQSARSIACAARFHADFIKLEPTRDSLRQQFRSLHVGPNQMAQARKVEGNRTPILARLLESLCVAISWFALILAAPIFVIACFDATHLTYRISPSDQDHIEVVSRYARTFIDQNKRLPDHGEYQNWVVTTDQQQGTRLDGRGYSLHTECAKEVGDFCVGFWAGDVWVTYRSGQANRAEAAIDGRLGVAWLEGVTFAGLLAIAVFFRWAASVKRRSPQFE